MLAANSKIYEVLSLRYFAIHTKIRWIYEFFILVTSFFEKSISPEDQAQKGFYTEGYPLHTKPFVFDSILNQSIFQTIDKLLIIIKSIILSHN